MNKVNQTPPSNKTPESPSRYQNVLVKVRRRLNNFLYRTSSNHAKPISFPTDATSKGKILHTLAHLSEQIFKSISIYTGIPEHELEPIIEELLRDKLIDAREFKDGLIKDNSYRLAGFENHPSRVQGDQFVVPPQILAYDLGIKEIASNAKKMVEDTRKKLARKKV